MISYFIVALTQRARLDGRVQGVVVKANNAAPNKGEFSAASSKGKETIIAGSLTVL